MRIDPTYKIGDNVYHATPDSDKGIILDIKYSFRNDCCQYNVSFGRRAEDDIWCFEEELTDQKVF